MLDRLAGFAGKAEAEIGQAFAVGLAPSRNPRHTSRPGGVFVNRHNG